MFEVKFTKAAKKNPEFLKLWLDYNSESSYTLTNESVIFDSEEDKVNFILGPFSD